MTRFEQALQEKDFVVTAELHPPRGTDLGPMLELAKALAPKTDALVVSDNPGAIARLSPVTAAERLMEKLDAEVIMTLGCRDRNRLAMTSEILAAGAVGVSNLLVVSGVYVNHGDQPGAKVVYDLDSVTALGLAQGLAAGRDLAGVELAGAPMFFLGAALAHQTQPPQPQIIKLNKKLVAGADFFITNKVQDLGRLKAFLAQAPAPIRVLASVEADDPERLDQAAELAGEIGTLDAVAGVHLRATGPDLLIQLVEQCGLANPGEASR